MANNVIFLVCTNKWIHIFPSKIPSEEDVLYHSSKKKKVAKVLEMVFGWNWLGHHWLQYKSHVITIVGVAS